MEIGGSRRWRLWPEVKLLDRDHRVGVWIFADRSGLYALWVSGYGERSLLGVFCQIDESRQQGDEAAGVLGSFSCGRPRASRGRDRTLISVVCLRLRTLRMVPPQRTCRLRKRSGCCCTWATEIDCFGTVPIARDTGEEVQPASSEIIAMAKSIRVCHVCNGSLGGSDFMVSPPGRHLEKFKV